MLRDVFRYSIVLLDRHRVFGLRGGGIVDEDNCRLRTVGDSADKTLVRFEIAQNPTAAVEVDNDRQLARCALGTHDMHIGLSGRPDGKGERFDVGRKLRNRAGLQRVEHTSSGLGRHVVNRRP